MIQDPSRNANIIPVSFDDAKPDKNRGGKPFLNHLGNMHQGNGEDIKKLLELYSGKSMSDFLAQNPLTPAQAHAPSKMPTESYRFDIMHIGNEEKCERRQFPGDRSRDQGTDESS